MPGPNFPNLFIPPLISKIVHIINFIFLIFVLFFERNESRRRFVWLLILFFLPGIGIILYVLFSGHVFTANKRMMEMHRTAATLSAPLRDNLKRILIKNRDQIPNHVIQSFLPLMDMNIEKANSMLSYADSSKIYCYGKEFFDELCMELENAKSTINMEYFIYRPDKIGRKIMDILCRKAQEGVEVKLLYDDFGSILTRTRFFRRLDAAGGKSRPFFLLRIGLPLTLNYRNHRKLTVIDSRIAFIGGMNIADEYANDNPHRRLNWRDTTIRLTGTCVFDLQTSFLTDWYSQDAWASRSKTLKEIAPYFPPSYTERLAASRASHDSARFLEEIFQKGRIPTQIVSSGPNTGQKSNIKDAFIRMIMSAKKNVYIETPYFTPNEEFYTALKLASYAGVNVCIVIPGTWDKFYMKAASAEFAREMCADGVKFFIYPGFIHSKMITVDRKIASIGTTNIDNRSFSLHFEQNVIFYDSRFASRCESIIERDMKLSCQVNRRYYDSKPMLMRAYWSFAQLFSPLM